MAESPSKLDCIYTEEVISKRWLSEGTFELTLSKPVHFKQRPGQKILCEIVGQKREYSLVNGVDDEALILCIRQVENGLVSPELARLNKGDSISFSPSYGFLVPRGGVSERTARTVMVATGTGIAPFISHCRSGVKDFILLHGVRRETELYYREEMSRNASLYVPCLSGNVENSKDQVFSGRVTDYLLSELRKDQYDFYLCGNPAMLKEAMAIIDAHFPGSKIFSEPFF